VKTRKLNEYRQQLKEGAENRLKYALADADTRYKEDLERVNAIKDTRLSQERSYAEQVDKIENDLAAASKQAKQHYSTALDLAGLQRKSRSKLVRQYGVSPDILEFARAPELTSLQRRQIKDTLWSSARQLAHVTRVRHVFVQLPDLQYRIDDVKRQQTGQTVRLKCGKEDEAEYSEISKLLGNTCGIRWPTLILPLDCPATASWNKGGKIRARDWILPVNVGFNPSTGEVEHLGSDGIFRSDNEYLKVMDDQARMTVASNSGQSGGDATRLQQIAVLRSEIQTLKDELRVLYAQLDQERQRDSTSVYNSPTQRARSSKQALFKLKEKQLMELMLQQ
jgi:hypothetical protein